MIDLMPELIRDGARRRAGLRQPRHPAAHRRWHRVARPAAPDDRAKVIDQHRSVHDAGSGPELVEARIRAGDGSWRTCELSAIRTEFTGATTVITSAREITERKRIGAQLMVADRMTSLGTLAAGIAHEINNPLAFVTGNLEMGCGAAITVAPFAFRTDPTEPPPTHSHRVARASAAGMASSPAGCPLSFELGPYGVPHTGVPVACRQLSASDPRPPRCIGSIR